MGGDSYDVGRVASYTLLVAVIMRALLILIYLHLLSFPRLSL